MNSNEETQIPPMPKRKCRRWMIPFFILIAVLVKGGIFLLLWNAIIPDLFQAPVLNFAQAVGLIIMAKLLFGGRHGFGGRGRFGGPFGRHRGRWKHMSDDEREKLRAALRQRC